MQNSISIPFKINSFSSLSTESNGEHDEITKSQGNQTAHRGSACGGRFIAKIDSGTRPKQFATFLFVTPVTTLEGIGTGYLFLFNLSRVEFRLNASLEVHFGK